jgi:TetR/AcrR family transcriptional regulator, cholesterol catabolism regulator
VARPVDTSDSPPSGIEQRRGKAAQKGSAGYQNKRRDIALAAGQVFFDRGYSSTTMAHLAEALELDRATLYYYFRNKEEILDSVVRGSAMQGIARAESLLQRDDLRAAEKIRELIVTLMQAYSDNFPILYVYAREDLTKVAGDSSWAVELLQLAQRYRRAIESIVEQGIKDGSIRPLGTASAISHGIVGIVSWTNRWFDPTRSPESAVEIGATFADMLLGGLTTSEASGPHSQGSRQKADLSP